MEVVGDCADSFLSYGRFSKFSRLLLVMVRKLRTPFILGYPKVGSHLVVRMFNDFFGASGVCIDKGFSQEVVCRGLGWPNKCTKESMSCIEDNVMHVVVVL